MIQRMTQELVDDITNYLFDINYIPYINQGGCGYVALSLYDLFARRGFKPKIRLLTANKSLNIFKQVTYNRRANNKSGMVANHYVVEVNNYYFDSRGGFSSIEEIPGGYGYKSVNVFRSDLIWLLKYSNEWNTIFKEVNDDDDDEIDKIRKYILSYNNFNRYLR